MIKINGKNIFSVYFGEKVIEKIYKGTLLVYEAWKKLIGVPSLTLLNCKGVDLVDYKIFGNSEQTTYKGLQLLDYKTITSGGATISIEDAGRIISITGKVAYAQKSNNYFTITPGETIYCSVKSISGGNNASVQLQYVHDNGYTFAGSLSKDKLSLNLVVPEGITKLRCVFIANNNYIALEEDVTAVFTEFMVSRNPITNWEPYVGRVTSPNPNYPQEICSVGDKSKNIFNYTESILNSANGLTNTLNSDGTITTVGTPTSDYAHIVSSTDISGLLEDGETYTLSQKYYNQSIYVQIRVINKNTGTSTWIVGGDGPKTFKVDKSANTYSFNIQTGSVSAWGSSSKTITNGYQLEKGNTATEFEPYGKYKIPVTVRGKNILKYPYHSDDITVTQGITFTNLGDGGVHITGISTNYAMFWLTYNDECPFKNNKQYIFSKNQIGEGGVSFYLNYLDDTGADKWTNTTILWKDTYRFKNLYIQVNPNTIIEDVTLYPQIEEGTVATEYERYVEPIKTNIYINEPLRKIGYYSDYIDFKNSKVIRNILQKNYRGKVVNFLSDANAYLFNIFEPKTKHLEIICNAFKTDGADWVNKNGYMSYSGSPWYQTRFMWDKFSSVDDANNWLAKNDIYVCYILETPTEEDIELPNIPTFKGTTIIEVDTEIQPSNMEVVYKGKTA